MRIAYTHSFCWPEVRRGAERLVAELSKAVAALGHDVTVFSSAYAHGRSREDGVNVVRFRRWRDEVFAAETDFGMRVLPDLMARRFDVVHSFGRRDGVASIRAAKLHHRRVTVHTDIGNPSRSWWATKGKEARYAERVIRDVDVYGCMSKYSLGVLAADYGREGAVIPGGVDLRTFVPASARTPNPTILYSGTLIEPRKGVADLLAALPLVAAEVPDVRLLLSGPGDAGPLLQAASPAARARTDVLGAGTIDEQPDRYGRAWACALPSQHDTFGLVLIESLACGTPVVAANNAALPELVSPGVTGALCEYRDPVSIARACVDAIELARHHGTADACRESAAPYDWSTAIAPRCVELYEQATASR